MAKSSSSPATPAYAVSSKTPVLPTSNGPNQQPSLRVFRNLGSKQQQLQRNNNGIPARPGKNDTPSPTLVSSTLAPFSTSLPNGGGYDHRPAVLGWLPLVAVIVFLFMGNIGYGTLIWVVTGEH